ncbi:hypothetical protein FHS31_001601 [Sphingomonas vulcanisoli]|uniref:DUF3089 domain-containing protein n=1 Tax=Sphingomonas vulcanisoli TaxID=1658060 RepID=A0ABX0TWK7_9SPHN|nr:DUF3089 domain-containing protein [Sphingomonas vulcanisoli]NIJ07991.1 hypothetical protein [Sphingomonas vulcanisoli]
MLHCTKDAPLLARKFLYVIAALIMLTLAGGIGWNLFQDQIMRWTFVPSGAFKAPAGRIDYAKAESWAARPHMPNDPSRWVPEGFTATRDPQVSVFFVAPTTYLKKDQWNGPIDDREANGRLTLFIGSQAGAFNAVGEVWAPRYRQATAGAFLTDEKAAGQALDFAYGDVEQAFDAFLAAIPPDRPIILAGHSQGSLHLMTLLARRVAGTPIAQRIVAAYLIGWPVSVTADLPKLGLPGCSRAAEPGCILAWQSFAEPADPGLMLKVYDATNGLTGSPRKGTPMLCVNPLTGAPNSAAPAAANLGALVPRAGMSGADVAKGIIPARCDPQGILLIGDPPTGYGTYVLPGQNYHIFDYALFWANIRADAEARTIAFLVARK